MSSRLNRILNRFWLGLASTAAIMLALYVGFLAGNREWPYQVGLVKVYTPDPAPLTPFRFARRINYFLDCYLHYDRRLQSLTPGPDGQIRRFDLPDVTFEKTPSDLDGVLQEQAIIIPADFPCGPAMLVDSPTAGCNWLQRWFWPLHRRDAIVKFNVSCQHAEQGPR